MRPSTEGASRPFHPYDLVVWPDGTLATCEQLVSGEFGWMSDGLERVRLDNADRLRELRSSEVINPLVRSAGRATDRPARCPARGQGE